MIYIQRKSGERINLNEHFVWEDEYQYSNLAQQQSRLITGALLIENSIKQSGRPITLSLKKTPQGLEGGANREDVEELLKWSEKYFSESLLLSINNRLFEVVWRAHDGLPVEADNVMRISNPTPETYVELILRFTQLKEIF